MDRKTTIKSRIMHKFIDAAFTVIDTEGIEYVTIRKVAAIAGYNSSTMYNYFENLDHLILFASTRYLRDYTGALEGYVKKAKTSLDRYLLIWECFCKYSFQRPQIYNLIFFSENSNTLNNIITEYYKVFPEELADSSLNLTSMLTGNDIYSRTLHQFDSCVKDGCFRKEDINEINEVTILLYQSILANLLRKNPPYTPEEALDKTMHYFHKIVESFTLPVKK
ncbi:MAG: TetR/AcrR family transcriptional regulator [Clostridiaceae bacterium]